MNQIMTLAEVNEKFDSEWVLFGDTEEDEHHEVIKGTVLWHSKDRDEVYRKLLEFRPKRSATHYTGSLPDDIAIIL